MFASISNERISTDSLSGWSGWRAALLSYAAALSPPGVCLTVALLM